MTSLRSLLRHHWRQHRVTLGLMAAVLAIFEFLLTRIAPTVDELGFVGNLLTILPPAIRALIGGEITISAQGFLTIGYNHPVLLVVLSAWVVRVSSAGLAAEVGRGTMDLVAARPVGRSAQVTGAALAVAAGLALLAAAAWAGTAAGLATRPIEVAAGPFVRVAAMLWLLFATWGVVGVLVSTTRRDAGSAIAWTSGLMVMAFALEYLARLWAPIAALRPFSLFAYYRPQELTVTGPAWPDLAILIVVAAVCLAAALWWFRRRDL